jgi:polar amino acid transport system substrate-binding protein
MRTSKLRLAALLALLLALVCLAASCGDDDDDGDGTETTGAETTGTETTGTETTGTETTGTETTGADTTGGATTGGEAAADFETIAGGTLTVCTDAPYEPFEFEDESGEWTGFDMELLRAMTTNWGLELSVTVVPFDGIWLLPAAGECDLVASAMTITEERTENALFSEPYFDADQSLLVRVEDEETFATLADLAGASIAVQTGTTGEAYAQENAPDDAEIVSFDEAAAMFTALEAGDVDAILQDFPVNGFRSTQDDQVVVTERFPTGEQYGFAASLDNTALIDAVNAQLAQMREDGTFDQIFADWFGTD